MHLRHKTPWGVLLGALLVANVGLAADHIDSPAVVAEPTADITDIYAWMSPDAEKLNLIMNVNPFAGSGATFSDAVQYVFHINSSATYGAQQTEEQVICTFSGNTHIECWAGDSYVSGDPSNTGGLANKDGSLRVFAGLRDDPFFMEFTGFTQTVAAVVDAAPSLSFDPNGCPELSSDVGAALRTQLASGASGSAATDTFAGSNVLSLVIQLDKSVVTSGGGLLGVWGSTHRSN
ncbi:MAG: DUF4331 family protein [Myxococcota bacterium]